MKVELNDNVQTMSVTEVVNALVSSGALEIDNGERLGEARLECGCDLEIDIMHDDPMDMRIHGCLNGAINRHDAAMRTSIRESDKADQARDRARAAANNHAISSDDPEALNRLRNKLAKLERLQEQMKAANAAIRLKDTAKGDAKLAELGFSPIDIAKLRQPDFMGRVGFPAYALTNNGATIRSVKERIAQLEARAAAPAPEGWTFDGGEVICNVDENRLQIRFDAIPDEQTRRSLKGNGFRWSRYNCVWQRQLTPNAISTARYLFKVA